MWAHITDRWHDQEGDHAFETAVTDIFERRDGQWRWVASSEAMLAGGH